MDTPESWLVEAVSSLYDLDNILLEEVSFCPCDFDSNRLIKLYFFNILEKIEKILGKARLHDYDWFNLLLGEASF